MRRKYQAARFFHGFTLVELLVVIGIIGLLIAILMPALQKARQQAQTTVCASNQRQIGLAALQYVAENRGRFPTVNVGVFFGVFADNFHDPAMDRLGVFYPLEKFISAPDVTICPSAPSTPAGFYSPGPQNYGLGSGWDGSNGYKGVFGSSGTHPGGSPIVSEPAHMGKVRRAAEVVMVFEMSRPTGRAGEAQKNFAWYHYWAPNVYVISTYKPFHGKNNSMNFTFVDGHVATLNVSQIPVANSGGYLPDWIEMGISYRRNY